mgnify:CR=1 FL=1
MQPVRASAATSNKALSRNILSQNHCDLVINLDKQTYAGNPENLEEFEHHDGYKFFQADICDQEAVTDVLSKYQVDAIVNFAAESHVDRSIDGPADFIDTNIVGTFNLLEAARHYYESLDEDKRDQFRFHHISTDEVYGDLEGTDDLFTEQTSYSPSSPYSASKAASDHLVRAWGRTYGFPIIITNCSNNYGPYHFPEKLIPHVILNAIHGKPLPVYGNGLQIRDWLYVEDHAKALIKVVTEGKVGETYNIGGHNEKTNLEVVQTICDLLEELAPEKPSGIDKYRDLITFVKDRPGHDARYAIDASKIERELGWVPEETFETGLRKTVQWYLSNAPWWERVLSGAYRMERIGADI